MGADVFRFKQFIVRQDAGVMRVNTDGVLLGALCTADTPHRILDIGTGTGVIALMMAQRFPAAQVEAIDFDAIAAACARENFKRSIYQTRMEAHANSVESFQPNAGYQLIVSNPPFFVEDLTNPNIHKRRHRHTDWSFFQTLFKNTTCWLADGGRFYIIWPPNLRDRALQRNLNQGLELIEEYQICSFNDKPSFRVISVFSKQAKAFRADRFVIYDSPGVYSEAYRQLLQAFLLPF